MYEIHAQYNWIYVPVTVHREQSVIFMLIVKDVEGICRLWVVIFYVTGVLFIALSYVAACLTHIDLSITGYSIYTGSASESGDLATAFFCF